MRLLQLLRTPPDCREVAKVLQSFLDGELPEDQTDKVAEHVEHCERCGIEADVYLQVKESLRDLRTPPDREAMQRLHAFAENLVVHGE
jgi:anti-sigma factor (TIGR02949 family)